MTLYGVEVGATRGALCDYASVRPKHFDKLSTGLSKGERLRWV